MSKLDCPSNIRTSIKQWLKSGVMDNGVFEETDNGTPQGGVISPLLANIALDGYVLMKHTDTHIIRHTLVKPEASPYDGNWVYWSKRRGIVV